MKKILLTTATALCLVGGGILTTSCDLGTAASALTQAALTNYATTGHLTGGNLAGVALQSIMKDKDMANVLGTLASDMLKNFAQRGTAVQYTGKSSLEALYGTYEPMAYNSIGKATPNLDVTLTTNAKTVAESNRAQLLIPAYTVGDVQTTDLVIANLGVTTNGTTSTIALTDNSGFGANCTCTYKGNKLDATTVYITEANVVGNTLTLNMTIYYGKEYTNPVNLTYTGTVK